MVTHTMEDGRSLCGQATEPGTGEPCRSCGRVEARRAREAAEAAERAEWFQRFRPGVFVVVEARNQAVAGRYMVTDLNPERESLTLTKSTGLSFYAERLAGGSFQLWRAGGGSPGCWVDVAPGAARPPHQVLMDIRRWKRRKASRFSIDQVEYLRLELQSTQHTCWGGPLPVLDDANRAIGIRWNCWRCGFKLEVPVAGIEWFDGPPWIEVDVDGLPEPPSSCPHCGLPSIGRIFERPHKRSRNRKLHG